MKRTTKILSLVLALAMVLSLGAYASAGPASSEEPAARAAESIGDMKVSDYATLDNFARDDTGYIYIGCDIVDGELTGNSNWSSDPASVVLDNTVYGAGFTAVHASGEMSDVEITGTLSLANTPADSQGIHASDFSGVGAAIVAENGASLNIHDADITTDGFVRAALLIDNEVDAWIKDSSFVAYGANPLVEAYDGYTNSANMGRMLSPPWVLGIQGGIRTMNVLSSNCTVVIEDSYLASGGWGVVSTDGCSTPYIYIVDSKLEILSENEGGMDSGWKLFGYDENAYGSGYGAYIIGSCEENYYGAEVAGATFGAIARDGYGYYHSSNGVIDAQTPEGESLGTIQGEGKVSTINAVFGGHVHGNEPTGLQYLDGTVVNSEEAAILYRSSGYSTFAFDNAQINSKSGILLQMIDDDDTTVGGMDPFNEYLYEDAGLPSQNGNETGKTEGCSEVTMTVKNGDYNGDFYNGTGYYGQEGDVLILTFGEGARVNGVVSLTETIHGMPYRPEAIDVLKSFGSDVSWVLMDEDFHIVQNEAQAAYIQFTKFSLREYYMLCHVLNHVYNNGYAGLNLTVENGAQWVVTGESVLSYLKVDGGFVYGDVTLNADGSVTLTPSYNVVPAGEYGSFVEANVNVSATVSGEPSGEAS